MLYCKKCNKYPKEVIIIQKDFYEFKNIKTEINKLDSLFSSKKSVSDILDKNIHIMDYTSSHINRDDIVEMFPIVFPDAYILCGICEEIIDGNI